MTFAAALSLPLLFHPLLSASSRPSNGLAVSRSSSLLFAGSFQLALQLPACLPVLMMMAGAALALSLFVDSPVFVDSSSEIALVTSH